MTRVVCIADDVSWRESITTYADTDLVCLAWSEFEQSALRYPQAMINSLLRDSENGCQPSVILRCTQSVTNYRLSIAVSLSTAYPTISPCLTG